jgi:hypothetical protein
MSGDDPKDYKVGKGKPPKDTRFKPGQSGNPKGRPKGAKSWKAVIEAELSAEIGLKEHGVILKVTKMEAFGKRLISDALAGNPKASSELLRQINKYFGALTEDEAKNLPATEDDVRLLMKYAHKAVLANAKHAEHDEQSDEF